MVFAAGDPVHVRAIGKGIVREIRNGGRCVVDVGGRAIVTTVDQLTAQSAPKKTKAAKRVSAPSYDPPSEAAVSIDLHSMTVDEAVEAVASFLNRALLAGAAEAHIIHGRSGGRLKSAVHAQLRGIPSIRGFGVDPRNAGVTIVKL